MKKLSFAIDKGSCNDLAYKIFMENAGIDREGRKFRKMKEAAMLMRQSIDDSIQIRASYAYYEDVDLAGSAALIGGQRFVCGAFEQIDPETIKGAYVYALSAGEFGLPEESIMDQLYADIWGTAFADAARLLLKDRLQQACSLSDSFGPGFYGMDVSAMAQIAKLVDFRELGIELRNSRIMLPLKSCAGIYFTVDENYREINQSCRDCLGTYTSCQLCQINGGN